MSSIREPVGPKPRGVYVRRRLIVLGIFVAIVAVIVLIIVKPGSNGGVSDAPTVEVPKDLVTSSPSDDDGNSEGSVSACATGQLAVEAITDKGDYAAGELPQFSLSVTNTGEDPCSADLGTSGMTFAVTSGSDEVWRSVDCQTNATGLAVILDAGQKLETEPVEWDRTRSSAESCDIARDEVGADGASYHLRATVGGVQSSGTAQFLLF